MTSFYPGPSRVYDAIPNYVKAAHRKGILSMNHRSEEFMDICEKTVNLLKEKLSVPKDYKVFFLTSATECWEVIAQSITKNKSHHIFSGAFGEKWFDYSRKLRPEAEAHPFNRETTIDPSNYVFNNGDVICITQNETSNGTQVSNDIIAKIHSNNPNHLIAVDATSSMAGIFLDFSVGDIWYASVQKCFGLPAGLSVMICSPRAMKRVKEIAESNHYNSATLLDSMMDKWQTPCTPNVLGIYLLMRTLKDSDHITKTEATLRSRHESWSKLIEKSGFLEHLVKNSEVHSFTVLAIRIKEGTADMAELKRKAKQAGFLLGEGYGDLKKDTFRIANFPAIRTSEIRKLMRFMLRYG